MKIIQKMKLKKLQFVLTSLYVMIHKKKKKNQKVMTKATKKKKNANIDI